MSCWTKVFFFLFFSCLGNKSKWFNDTWEKSSWSLAIPSSHKFKQSAYQYKKEHHQVFQEFHLGMLSKPLVVSHFLVRYLLPCWSDLHTNCLEACGSQSIWNHKSNEFDIFSGQHYLRKAHGKWSSSLWDYSLKKKNQSDFSTDADNEVGLTSQCTKGLSEHKARFKLNPLLPHISMHNLHTIWC